MRRGKISEITLKRSVLKNIRSKNRQVVQGAGLSNDASEIQLEGITVVMSSNCIDTWFEGCIDYNITKTLNNIYVQGAEPIAAQLSIVFPAAFEEQKLGKLIKELDQAFGKKQIQISGGHTVVSEEIEKPMVMFTILGKKCYNVDRLKDVEPGDEIVMTKSIAVGGTGVIAHLKEETLTKRFANSYVNRCMELIQNISVQKECEIVKKNYKAALHDISTGGVFAGLWELTSASGLGVTIDLQKIPVWQETVEVAELFDINPYELDGTGSLLIVTKQGEEVADRLQENGIEAQVIGVITKERGRVLMNGEETRFLEPQRGDEIYKILDAEEKDELH